VRIYRVAARVYVDGMRLRSLSITLGLGIGLGLAAAPARAQKAVFVVRHAEKVSEQDQSLTEAGRARARRLSEMLADAGITEIYATDTARARDTAKPLADRLKLQIQTYDTGGGMSGAVDARPFVGSIRKDHAHDVVLVVGHSNTIPDLLRALGCAERISLAADQYDDVFAGGSTLVRLKY
jgi:broad specificity phosphatase PhoE